MGGAVTRINDYLAGAALWRIVYWRIIYHVPARACGPRRWHNSRHISSRFEARGFVLESPVWFPSLTLP